jgi:hypothetical protein
VEFFSYGVLGRSVCASQVDKIIYSGCACFCFPSFVDSHPGHVISANLNILSRPSLIELFSRDTKFRSGFLSMLSIEEAIDKGLKKFVNKQEEEELLGVQGILSEWKAKVLLFVQKRTRAASWTRAAFVDSCFLRGPNFFQFFFVCSFSRSRSPKDSPTVLCHYLHG